MADMELLREYATRHSEIIGDLRAKDRDAIVLRFLQGKDYRQVAAALGATEEAAQMRVSRALEKMRKMFASRGVVVSAAALGSAIAAQGTQAAPAGLAATVAAGAVHGAALTVSTLTLAEGALKIMAWTKAKVVIGAGVVVLLAFQHHQNAVQAGQIAAARQKLDGQAQALAGARTPATLLSATLNDPNARETLRRALLTASHATDGALTPRSTRLIKSGEQPAALANCTCVRP